MIPRVSSGLLAAALLAACQSAPGGQPAIPVAMFRGDAAHSGNYPGSSDTSFGGLLWRVQTGGAVHSTPVMAAGMVYAGSGDHYLYAIDAANGVVRWRYRAAGAIQSSPAVARGTVFFVDRADTLYALDAHDGTRRWARGFGHPLPLPWGHESGDRYTSSPAVYGTDLLVGGRDGGLYRIRAGDGHVVWRYQADGQIWDSPAVRDSLVYAGATDGVVYGVSLADGKQRWRFGTLGQTLGSDTFGFDRRTVQSSPAVSDSTVFIGARDGFLYALNRLTGAPRWHYDHDVSWVNTSPALAGGLVFDGSSDGRFVQAVDAVTGEERWRDTTDGIVWSSPAVAENIVFAGDGAGNLLALDRATGRQRWRYRAGGGIYSSPVPGPGMLCFGSVDGAIYAVRLRSGPALDRAVFWDSTVVHGGWFAQHATVRDFLAGQDYRQLDSRGLIGFLQAHSADGVPSVVVFALDYLPPEAAAGDSLSLFRRYLEAGGKVVWLGVPPLLFPRDPASGRTDLSRIDRSGPARLLGVTHQGGNFDPVSASPTDAARRWGIEDWWISNWSADPQSVSTVLARDEMGLAAAWVKSYGGPPGTGFVRLYGGQWQGGMSRAQLLTVQAAAEYMPRGKKEEVRSKK